jgi:O-antigen/teichoic acid export membrane protein
VNWWIAWNLLEKQQYPEAFAKFSIGMQWFSLALFVPLALSQVLFPRFVRMSDSDQLPLRTIATPALMSCAMVAVVLLVAVLSTPVLSIVYGQQLTFSRPFVLSIMLAACLSAPAGILGQAIIAASGAGTWLKLYLVFLVLGGAIPIWWPPETELSASNILVLVNAGLLLVSAGYLWLTRRVSG